MKRSFVNGFDFNPADPIVIPFGRYPHKKSGTIQVIDRRSAAGFANNIAEARANGAPGLPIYAGHPDVPELASLYPDKGAKGWVTDCQVECDACRLATVWNDQPKPGAFIYFSPYFFADDPGKGKEALIDELRSIGLTNRPNSTRFRLPNEAEDDATETHTEGTTTMMKVLLLLGLPNTATEDEAAAKLTVLMDETTALRRKDEESGAQLKLANEAAESARQAFANEREQLIALKLDCALADGRITAATRPVWQDRLRKDFANESATLASECAKLKTRTSLPNTDPSCTTDAGILAQYEAMPRGKEKAAFLAQHVHAINNAREGRKA